MSSQHAFLLRLGDSNLVLGQQLGAWCGHGPILEEDIAMTNVALDLIGQAQYWLDYAGELEGEGRDSDALAYFREADAFRNYVLVERPNGDFGDSLMRQFFYDAWHYLLLTELSASADTGAADIAGKAIKEVRYHLQRSGDWIARLGDGTEESHARVQRSADTLWNFTGDLFKLADDERDLVEQGLAVDVAALRQPWLEHVQQVFAEATLTVPDGPQQRAGRLPNEHTEALSFIIGEMQSLRRAHPQAQW